MLFSSGSSSLTRNAKTILAAIQEIIGPVDNYVRVRGYTDNQPINTEIFPSNWELSIARATAVVRELEQLQLIPARMAIEGYGEYYPTADNMTAEGRAANRRVVIAISTFAYSEPEEAPVALTQQQIDSTVQQLKALEKKQDDNTIKIIQLENGALRITTRSEDPDDSSND